MKNEWLDIKLSDYESHMSMPGIEQAQFLSNNLSKVVDIYKPNSLALLGCAGGNGLDNLESKNLEKIICCDINPHFLNETEKRYSEKFNNIEFICGDIVSQKFSNTVNLIYAALIFEYVNIELAVKNISKYLIPEGILAIIIQLPNEEIPDVSPSPYKNLEILNNLFSFVQVEKLNDICRLHDLNHISQNEIELNSGKRFAEIIFRKSKPRL